MADTTFDPIRFRHHLHQLAEISGGETRTAGFVAEVLRSFKPDQLVTDLGGKGLAAIFTGKTDGPTVLIRCELDALPITENLAIEHASRRDGVAHKCGHDGHMAIVTALAPRLKAARPERGRVVLLFQPAEETGQGARAVLNDPAFAALKPDWAFALHNLPGVAQGTIATRQGTFASASVGMIATLGGASAHAGEPELARTPALALAQLIQTFSAAPQLACALNDPAKVTVIHAKLGERAFGTTPGHAVLMATLRAATDPTLDHLKDYCEQHVRGAAQSWDLDESIDYVEAFPATVNDAEATHRVADAADSLGLKTQHLSAPFSWSEDFGHFTATCKGALFGLGSGEHQPALHHPDYDFPDRIIDAGTNIFERIIRELLSK